MGTSSLNEMTHRMNSTPKQLINGKPVHTVPTKTIINFDSGFRDKLLCDGLTFTCGSACVYRCAYCYVEPIMGRNAQVRSVLKQTGLGFQDVVIRRSDPLAKVAEALSAGGLPLFDDPADKRVIYGSPLVDVAATMELVEEL